MPGYPGRNMTAPHILDSLYEQFTAMSSRPDDGGSSSSFTHGRRAALARARLFVLDQQAGESALIL